MVWAKIKKMENSEFNDSVLVYFDYFGKEVFSIVSKKVLNYLNIDEIYNYKEIFVLKSFNDKQEPIYLIKKIK